MGTMAADVDVPVAPRRKNGLASWTPVGLAVVGLLIIAYFIFRPTSTPSLVGQVAPGFTVQDINGHPLRLADLRGRPVVLNFWGVNCIYCRKEMPLLQQAYQQHQGARLAIVGIDVQDNDPTIIRTYVQQRGTTYPATLPGSVDWGGLYKVNDLPQSVFIDRQGMIRESDAKPFLDAGSLEQSLATIL